MGTTNALIGIIMVAAYHAGAQDRARAKLGAMPTFNRTWAVRSSHHELHLLYLDGRHRPDRARGGVPITHHTRVYRGLAWLFGGQ